MKDSKEYSKKIRKLFRSLKRRYAKPEGVDYQDAVEAVVYATISERMTWSEAQNAFGKVKDYFVDWNDLRVSLAEEMVEVLGQDNETTRDIAGALSKTLGAIFEKYNQVTLEPAKKLGKRPAKQLLEQMNSVTRFVVDYCMLTALTAHAIPLTERMIEYLRESELVHPEADVETIEGFLARQIAAKDGYDFYILLRRESESTRAIKRKAKKTTKSKTRTKNAGAKRKKTKKRTTVIRKK